MTKTADTPHAGLPYRPCVGLMILNGDGRIFAGRRIDGGGVRAPGAENRAWQMPQGGVDPGESAEVAALRELGEETGLAPDHVTILRRSSQDIPYDLPEALIGKLWGGKYRGQIQTWFALRLLAPDAKIAIDTEEPEFDAWAWMSPDDLMTHIVPFKRDVYEAVFVEFSDLIGSEA